ncbi:flagellar assembly factor fliW [Paenibacillus alvei TS-15]|uniref:Flagellar assembly factor FliW n=1 Tax=Paenibacillus alvei TS-15 TaxID=1117108 RepID=S9SQD5_PAEAL|nr:flagellar assembly protein FliW [Paenibacillus alvei]EPY07957.1 flagellar assembly factor fliW [Paenibacillus alvei TS-15]
MEVKSSRLGILQVSEEDFVGFQEGVLGFPESKTYVWLNSIEPDLPIELLQCTRDSNLAFMVVDPFEFASEYEFDLSEETKHALDISSQEQVVIRVILTARQNSTTINLKAPLIINVVNRRASQIILDGPQYQLQYPIGRG